MKLRVKNRISRIQSSVKVVDSSEMGGTLLSPQVHDGNNYATDLDGTGKHEIILRNRIRELETALQKAREETYQTGYDEGKAAALSETKKQMEDISEEFSAMVQSLKGQYDRALEKMNEPLLILAMKIAEKIIGRTLQHDEEFNEILLNQIKHLLVEVADQNIVTVHVNPKQINWVTGLDINKELQLPAVPNINFVVNEKLNPGECLVETEDYIIEGVLSTQLNNLVNRLLEREIKWND